jgi:hypothetical protein
MQPDPQPTNTVVIEADTVEQALQRLSVEVGTDARIVRADRVRRGGIAGFFAREVVEIEAELPTAALAAPAGGVDAVFGRMLAEAEETLAVQQRPVPVVTVTAPPPPPLPAPIERAVAPKGVVTIGWDTARMLEIGLPGALVQAVAALDPSDDLGHITALTTVLAPVCGPFPEGAHRLVGPRADRLRAAVALPESEDGLLHLVVGDELPESLPGVPSLVSWVTDRGAARAISLALGTGAKLGYGIGSGFGAPVRRISAVEAALAVRDLMERI